jgi:hypothetical protein
MAVSSYTLLDVVKRVAFGVGNYAAAVDSVENPDPKTFQLVECINRVIRKISQVKGLPMLNAEDSITTLAYADTGVVTVTQGSTEVVAGTSVLTNDMVGWAFTTKAYNGIFRVASVTSGTVMNLDSPWPFATDSSQTFIMAQDRYALPSDFGDFISVSIQGDVCRPLSIKTPKEIDFQRHTMRGSVLAVGAPNMVTVFDRTSSGNWMAELDPFPDGVYQISFRYKKVAARILHDNDVVPVADEHIDLLIDGATALWKQITNVDGAQNAYMGWIANDLVMHASMDRKSTDDVFSLQPADVTRRSVASGSGGIDAYPLSFSR